jgi:hypothetical protein
MPEKKGPEVEVENLKTNAVQKFHMPWESTLEQVWNKAYELLGEGRGAADQFQCADGKDLMGSLNKTLEQLREGKVCQNRHFQIRGPTGGASGVRSA